MRSSVEEAKLLAKICFFFLMFFIGCDLTFHVPAEISKQTMYEKACEKYIRTGQRESENVEDRRTGVFSFKK